MREDMARRLLESAASNICSVSLLESLELSSPPDILKDSGSPSELLSLILPALMNCLCGEREGATHSTAATLLSCDLRLPCLSLGSQLVPVCFSPLHSFYTVLLPPTTQRCTAKQ